MVAWSMGLALPWQPWISSSIWRRTANFLDIAGGAGMEKVAAAFRLLLADLQVKSVLVNIFGGITRCDEVARGMIQVFEEMNINLPVVVRLEGNHAQEAHAMLKEKGINPVVSFSEAAKTAVKMAKGK